MGTNYYAVPKDETLKTLHIGRYSNGCQFMFQAYPKLNLVSIEKWAEFLQNTARRNTYTILDEYYQEIDYIELLIKIIRARFDNTTTPIGFTKVGEYYFNKYDFT